MIELKKLTQFTFDQQKTFGEIAYTSDFKFELMKKTGDDEITFTLKLIKTGRFYVKIWLNDITSNIAYSKLLSQNNSFGAYDGEVIIGFVITERRSWNNSLWIEHIMVDKRYKNKGIGTSLLKLLEDHAIENKFRMIELETQNTNVPAINFYRKNKYEFAGVNITLYDPADAKDEIAIYMSKII